MFPHELPVHETPSGQMTAVDGLVYHRQLCVVTCFRECKPDSLYTDMTCSRISKLFPVLMYIAGSSWQIIISGTLLKSLTRSPDTVYGIGSFL